MDYAYVAAGVTAIIFFAYRYVSNYLEDRRIARMKEENDQAQQKYKAEIEQSTKEIEDAKLRYQSAKSKLDSELSS